MNPIIPDMQHTRQNMTFDELYIALRETENRICSDEELAQLPSVNPGHMYFEEWMIRKSSFERFRKYLMQKKMNLRILEVGCGNGWLSNSLSNIPGAKVTGTDINLIELEQARRVFHGKNNLDFITGDIRTLALAREGFDIVVFAASIQYFQSPAEIITKAMELLKPGGEVHIIDSKFYKHSEAIKAKERSMAYFHSLGFDEMSDAYFHHSLENLRGFDLDVMYDPNQLFNQILKRKDPFHWIMISKK